MSKIVRSIPLATNVAESPFEDDALDLHGDALVSLARVAHRVATPPAEARARFMDRLAQTHRFPEFVSRIAELAELGVDAVEKLLLAVDDKTRWEPGPVPKVELLHFQGGPSRRDAITGFVRVAAGVTFPMHEHVGTETVVVLQGALRDSEGALHVRGDEIEMSPKSSHDFHVVGEQPLIYLVVVEKGVMFGDVFIGPFDPRG
jgi:hypothetical protein